MSDIALLYTTFADQSDAERVAEAVIGEQLAACVNILAPCTSLFRWEGKLDRAKETPALFKTTPELATRLRDRIVALHPYDLPVVEMWPVAATGEVAGWIARETQGSDAGG